MGPCWDDTEIESKLRNFIAICHLHGIQSCEFVISWPLTENKNLVLCHRHSEKQWCRLFTQWSTDSILFVWEFELHLDNRISLAQFGKIPVMSVVCCIVCWGLWGDRRNEQGIGSSHTTQINSEHRVDPWEMLLNSGWTWIYICNSVGYQMSRCLQESLSLIKNSWTHALQLWGVSNTKV